MYSGGAVFVTGMLISFLGSLPLGSLNVCAMQIAVAENIRNAARFAAGVALVEVLYVRLSLKGIVWITAHQQIFYILEWTTVFVFIIMAVSSFRAANQKRANAKNILFDNNMNRFLLGFTMSAINPVQVPFWFIWSTYLISNKILSPAGWQFNIYTAGIGTGTLLGLALFIVAGRWLLKKLHTSQRMVNIIVGIVFIVSAILQLYRVVYRPFNQQLQNKPALLTSYSSPQVEVAFFCKDRAIPGIYPQLADLESARNFIIP
jgi:threonine/homoserine/homoserine lactone efflux protein